MTEESNDIFIKEVKDRHKEMEEILENIDIDSIKYNGLRISIGGKTFEFNDLKVVDEKDIEQRIRQEYKVKLNGQQQRIRDKINSKINQLLVMHQQKQKELDRKEEKLKIKYSKSAMMPDINENHLIKGLSVVKGESDNELTWVYRAVYNPKFIIYFPDSRVSNNNKVKVPLPIRLANKMKTDILIIIRTKNTQVMSVATRKINNDNSNILIPFPHYHQQTHQDCWGSWKYPTKWNNPNDILKIAKDAEAVLEIINQGSLASHNPSGLPKMATIISNVEKLTKKDIEEIKKTMTKNKTSNNNISDEDIWNSI